MSYYESVRFPLEFLGIYESGYSALMPAVTAIVLNFPDSTCFQLVPPAKVVTGVILLVVSLVPSCPAPPLLPQIHKVPSVLIADVGDGRGRGADLDQRHDDRRGAHQLRAGPRLAGLRAPGRVGRAARGADRRAVRAERGSPGANQDRRLGLCAQARGARGQD